MTAAGRDSERMPFGGSSGEDFDWLTDAGLRAAADNPHNVFGAVLGLLAGCRPAPCPTAAERRGPTYALLRAVADVSAMTPEQGEDWVSLAESLALSERHFLHIASKLKSKLKSQAT